MFTYNDKYSDQLNKYKVKIVIRSIVQFLTFRGVLRAVADAADLAHRRKSLNVLTS